MQNRENPQLSDIIPPINIGGDAMKIFDIPFYPKFKIDKDFNIYIDDEDKITKVTSSERFIFEGKEYFVRELIDLSFYGVRNRFLYEFHTRIDDDIILINGDEFKKIPNLLDGSYYISNYGAIYSTHRNRLRKQEIDRDGYHRVSFPYNDLTHIAIHRLVYASWIGPIPKDKVIDHKDDHKWNNHYENLQAITAFENSRKAAINGAYCKNFHWTEDNVHAVCKMMQDNMLVKDIANKFGITPEDTVEYKRFRNQLYHIRKGDRSWRDISSQYDLSNYTGNIRPDSKYRNEEILEMRKLYQGGISITDIAKIYHDPDIIYISKLIRGLKRKRV